MDRRDRNAPDPPKPHDTARVVGWEFDVLVNNAGVGEGGPISEIPMDLVRRNFEVNVFAPLDLTQRVVQRWVRSKIRGKIVFVSSALGVISSPMVGAYSATTLAYHFGRFTLDLDRRALFLGADRIDLAPCLRSILASPLAVTFQEL